MGKKRRSETPVRLSECTQGVNRLVDQATRGQCSAGFDVLADEGDVYRRPAIQAIAHAPPFLLPAGRTIRARDTGSGPSISPNNDPIGSSDQYNYLGYRPLGQTPQVFSGFSIYWASGASALAYRYIKVEYYNGSAWVDLFAVDYSSVLVFGRTQPFFGRSIAWFVPSDWETTSVDSTTTYWVRVSVVDSTGASTTMGVATNLRNPGLQIFNLGRVTSMDSVRVRGTSAIVCSTALERGSKGGSKIGLFRDFSFGFIDTPFVLDQGPGVFGAVTYPALNINDVPTGSTSAGPGSAGRLTKIKTRQVFDGDVVDFDWVDDQFLGGVHAVDQTPLATFSTSSVVLALGSHRTDFFEHFRLRVSDAGTTSLTVGETVEVVGSTSSSGNATLYVYPDLSDTPNSSVRFDVFLQPARASLAGLVFPGLTTRMGFIDSNDSDSLEFDTAIYSEGEPVGITDGHYRVTRDSRWHLPLGRYSVNVDPVTGDVIIATGGDMLRSDGFVVSPLVADRTSSLARQLIGESFDDVIGTDPSSVAKRQLRPKPPQAKFITFYQARIVVAGIRGRPFEVAYSYPGTANNIWPLIYSSQIRDADQAPVTGLAVLNERLIAFTNRSIHEGSVVDDDGRIRFNPISQGYGFVDQQAVVTILGAEASMIVGVGQDGINKWDGGAPSQVLDRWDRVLPGGVNQGRLSLASAAALPQDNLVFFSVPSSGSDICDRIIVWDYARNTFYPWRFEPGVSSMGVVNDINRREELFIGTESGLVCTLVESTLENGAAVDAFVETLPLDPMRGQEVKPTRMIFQAKVIGPDQTMNVEMKSGDSPRAINEANLYVDQGDFHWGTGTYSSQAAEGRLIGGSKRLPTEFRNEGHEGRRLVFRIGGSSQWRIRQPEVFIQPGDAKGRD